MVAMVVVVVVNDWLRSRGSFRWPTSQHSKQQWFYFQQSAFSLSLLQNGAERVKDKQKKSLLSKFWFPLSLSLSLSLPFPLSFQESNGNMQLSKTVRLV